MGLVLLRLLSRRGRYPEGDIAMQSHVLCVTDSVPWTAVLKRVQPSAEEYSEVQVLTPEEVQLFAAIALAVKSPAQNGHLGPEPLTHYVSIELPIEPLNLQSTDVLHLLKDRAAVLIAESHADLLDDCVRGRQYEYSNLPVAEATVELVRAINVNDRLLIRGLAKFLVARALSHERWFLEEAGIAAFTSIEAALSIIRQRLEPELGREAAFDDGYEYLRMNFPTGEPLVEWLRELYDLRTIAVHPSSRFGVYWTPPMDADHCLEAIDWLIPLYRNVILQEIPDRDAA